MYPDNDYRSYLEHGTKGKRWTWPLHKYIEKEISESGKIRYIYGNKKSLFNAKRKDHFRLS